MTGSTPKPKRCVCGNYPKVEMETHYYGGGRYKGQTRIDSWEAICTGKDCCQRAYKRRGIFKTEKEAVAAWNEAVSRVEERRDAPDRLIYDLEHSGDDVKKALARLLKAAEAKGGE